MAGIKKTKGRKRVSRRKTRRVLGRKVGRRIRGGTEEICKSSTTANHFVEVSKNEVIKRYNSLEGFKACPEVIGKAILDAARNIGKKPISEIFKIDGYNQGNTRTFSTEPISATVINLSYYMIVLKLKNDRILFLQKYPAAVHTGVKLTHPPSEDSTQPTVWSEEMKGTDLAKLKEFWGSAESYYPSKDHWKGGKWAEKAIPGEGEEEYWCKGVKLGEEIQIVPIKESDYDWKVNVKDKFDRKDGKVNESVGYLTDNPMPQAARDVIVIFEHDTEANHVLDKYYIVKTTRGNNDDMQGRVAIGAGEHLEPTDSKLGTNESIMRAIEEEIGDISTVSNEVRAFRISMGIFNAYGRDPRYTKYYIDKDTAVGIDRLSVSYVDLVLVPPITKKIKAGDEKEIANAEVISLRKALEITDTQWGWIDHAQFVHATIAAIQEYELDKSTGKEFNIKVKPPSSK